VRSCAQCGGEVAVEHRFCPWCAAPQRLKLVRFFPSHPAIDADRGKMLRVSFYLSDEQHVRFSVWNEDGVAEAAVSLSPAEARRLAAFVANPCGSPQGRLGAIVDQLRADVERAFARSGKLSRDALGVRPRH
jgi:hypothetical protein